MGSGGNTASFNLFEFIKRQNRSKYFAKVQKQPESDDNQKGIHLYLQDITMEDYFEPICNGLK